MKGIRYLITFPSQVLGDKTVYVCTYRSVLSAFHCLGLILNLVILMLGNSTVFSLPKDPGFSPGTLATSRVNFRIDISERMKNHDCREEPHYSTPTLLILVF